MVIVELSGRIGRAGDGESGVLLEAAWRPTKYSRIGIGWNFTSFSDDELAQLLEPEPASG